MREAIKPVAALLAAFLLALCLGCGGSSQGEGLSGGEGGLDGGAAEEQAQVAPRGDVVGGRTVHMCGRSVLAGWFEHWGWGYGPGEAVDFRGYSMLYHEMESPPGISETARAVIDEVAASGGGTVFFKLCFADFEGGDRENAAVNLERNEGIVREVVDYAMGKGNIALMVGNALPLVREYCDRWLVGNQREYNAFLRGLEEKYRGRVHVLDFYGTLSAAEGWLRPEYAINPYDSHLNNAAYQALDPVLERALASMGGT